MFKRMTEPMDVTKTGQNQQGPRWQKIPLLVDLEPYYMLIAIILGMLNNTPTSAMTVLTIKAQFWGAMGQFLEIPTPSSK